MKKETINTLRQKYEAGLTSLDEEAFLFDNAKNSTMELQAWATYVKNNKKEIPKNLNETLWTSFEKKKLNNRKLKIKLFAAAASVLLIVSLFINSIQQKELSNTEKEMLLKEALSMFDTNTKKTKNIIYENELLLIYTD